jgi:hypothetical protein
VVGLALVGILALLRGGLFVANAPMYAAVARAEALEEANPNAAVDAFVRLAGEYPNSPAVLVGLAEAGVKAGRWPEAGAALERLNAFTLHGSLEERADAARAAYRANAGSALAGRGGLAPLAPPPVYYPPRQQQRPEAPYVPVFRGRGGGPGGPPFGAGAPPMTPSYAPGPPPVPQGGYAPPPPPQDPGYQRPPGLPPVAAEPGPNPPFPPPPTGPGGPPPGEGGPPPFPPPGGGGGPGASGPGGGPGGPPPAPGEGGYPGPGAPPPPQPPMDGPR